MEAFAPIDRLIPLFLDVGAASNDFLGEVGRGFFQLTLWAAILWGAIRVTVGADSLEGTSVQVVGWFLRIFILGTIGAFLLPTIIPALIEGALGIGTGISGGTMSAADFITPSKLAIVGWTEVEKLLKHAMSRCNGMYSCFTNFPTLIYYFLASLVVLASFVAMIIMIILSYIFFIMEGIGVLINIGFMGSDRLSWLGRGGPATLASRFNQLIIMSASLSIGSVIFETVRLTGEPSLAQAVVAAVVALIVAILVLKSEQIGSAIVGGMPGAQTGHLASGMMGATAGFLGVGAGAGISMIRAAFSGSGGSDTTPPTPSSGGGGGGSGGGSGHGGDPFGPNTSTATQAGSDSADANSAGESSAASSNWRGQGPGGLGSDIGGMSSERASATISDRAKQIPPGHGMDLEAPTAQQWGDAKLMGTDITGMSRGQARAALDAHQGWFEARNGGTPTVRQGSSDIPADIGAPSDWMSPQRTSTGASPSGTSTAAVSTASTVMNGTRTGFGASPASSAPGSQPPMRSASFAAARKVPAPRSDGNGHRLAMSSYQNDGRFQIGEDSLSYVGQGGGWAGTGYRGPNPQPVSARKKAIPALSGETYWQRRDRSKAREAHFGQAPVTPTVPKSVAAHL